MDAVVRGAMQAGKPVAGFKISKEAGEWTSSNYHPYLPDHTYMTCRFVFFNCRNFQESSMLFLFVQKLPLELELTQLGLPPFTRLVLSAGSSLPESMDWWTLG